VSHTVCSTMIKQEFLLGLILHTSPDTVTEVFSLPMFKASVSHLKGG
jgi:hypothetical protein